MALRTQVDPYVLIGDSLADLPPPGSVAQGTLFHEELTGTCRVLVIDPVTQVRTWEDFCGGATGATGATGPTGVGSGAFAFGGSVVAPGGGLPRFLANQVAGDAAFALGYPVPAGAVQIRELTVHFRVNTLTQPASLRVFVNGAPVGVPVVVPASTAGVFGAAQAIPVAPGDVVDLALTTALTDVGGAELTGTVSFG